MRELGEMLEPRSAIRHMRRFAARAALGVALLFVYGLLAVASAQSEGTRAELSAAVENGHGRLVFAFSDYVKADVQVSNGILIVSFDRPVSLSTEMAERRLSGYVQAMRRDPDGTALRLALARKVTVNVMEAGDRLFVDLLPEGWSGLPPGLPQSVIDDLAKRARDAEKAVRTPRAAPAQASGLSIVQLRVSSAPTFTRFAFELPGPISVATEREGQELRLHFNSSVRIDLGAARAQLPRGVVGLDVAFEERRSTVKLVLAPNAEAREFREDRAILVDVTPGPLGDAAPAVIQNLVEETEVQAEHDRAKAEAAAKEEAAEAEKAALRAQPPLAEVAGDDIPPSPLDFTTSPGGIVNSNLVPILGRHDGNFSIDFAFADPVAAAVFTRGDNVWVLFDTPRAIDVSGLTEEQTRTVHQAQYLRSDLGAAVRLKLTRARLPSIEREGNLWRLTLADSVASPSRPLPLRRASGADEGGAVLVPLESPSQVHRIADPEVGDTVFVVTAHPPVRGVLRGQNFVEFRALASVHGLAFVPLADDLAVTLTAEGAVVRRPDGLAVSNLPAPPPPPKQIAAPRRASPLDPDTWQAEQAADFAKREGQLVDAVSSSPAGQRADARLMLARFYLAHRFSAEAIGVLEAGMREDNQLTTRPHYFLLRGLAELEMGRPATALELFKNAKLEGVPEAALLRAVANADLARWTPARDILRVGADALPDLPVELQRRVLFAAARSAIEVRDLNEATRHMQDLEVMTVPPEQEPEFVLLAGRVAEGVGRFERAKSLYAAVAELDYGPAAAEAQLRSVAMRQARGELDRGKAIERLETLAIAWRGDRIELETIRLLGRFYVAEARYRDAFKLLDAALIVDAEADMTHEFHGEMGAVFEDLFLTGKAESLPSIEALALYYDFSRLTPIGRRGDELIRRLADRLVAVDLLDQAAELLDHQVNYRLTGAAKAQVAAKLAVVHLMNRKPVEAVRVIAGSRMPQLPQQLREQRLFVEARALSETGRHDTALELMENLRGPEADRLRADIHWSAKNWREAGERLEAIVGESWKEEGPLEPSDRHDVLRAALAYTLGQEEIGLTRIKDKFVEKMGDTTEGKVLQLLVSEEGATPRTLTEAARALASFDSLGTFIKRYRERFPEQPLPPDPMPTSSLFKVQRVSGR
jgi:tetratricopeptide (TPR) repeat protein